MEESTLNRRVFLKTLMLGGAAFLLPETKEAAAAEFPANLGYYGGQPSIGEPGYAERIAKIFGQAPAKKL